MFALGATRNIWTSTIKLVSGPLALKSSQQPQIQWESDSIISADNGRLNKTHRQLPPS